MEARLQKLTRLGRPLLLVSGLALAAMGLLVVVASDDLIHRLLAALVFASGVIVVLLGMLLSRMNTFRLILRHVQYLTQAFEYTARLVREITEVMKAIEEAEAEQREQKQGKKAKAPRAEGDEEDPEIEKAVRQFEV